MDQLIEDQRCDASCGLWEVGVEAGYNVDVTFGRMTVSTSITYSVEVGWVIPKQTDD